VHVARFENGTVETSHICQSCAEELGEGLAGSAMMLAAPGLLGRLLGDTRLSEEAESGPTRLEDDCYCGTCGTTLTDFRETGLLGCAHCYEVFTEHLPPAGEPDQSSAGHAFTAHTGKVPHRPMAAGREGREILRLRRMLTDLVDSERFEEAASVRDRLSELGEQLPRG
jgi:protein arginine kinase activator